MKLATANEQLLDSVKSINKIGSLEKEIIEIDKLSIHIDEMEDAIKEKLSQIKKVEIETAWTENVSAIWIWIEEHPCITQVWGENRVEKTEMKLSREKLGAIRREFEDLRRKYGQVDTEIKAETQKGLRSVEEM